MRSTRNCGERVDPASRGFTLSAAHRSVRPTVNRHSTAVIKDRINADAAFVQP
jgi:hypothetical protein